MKKLKHKTKILFILTYYRPHWTGLTQYAARVAEGLSKRGYFVTVTCSQHQKNLPKKELINNVHVLRIPYFCRFLRSVIMPLFPFVVLKQIWMNKTIVIYLPLQQVLLVTIMAKILGKKVFLVHNGDLVLPQSYGLFCRLVEKVYFITTYLSSKIADGIIIQSEDYASKSKLLGRLSNKWELVLPLFQIPNITKEEIVLFKKKWKINNKTLIGFSGRFVEEKGVDRLLNSLPNLLKRIPNTCLLLAGDNRIRYEDFWPKIQKLVKKNSPNVRLLGLLNEKDIYTFYKTIDVLVQPSRSDCFPSSQIEALLTGTPSVCADIPGARWVVLASGMGLATDASNPETLANAIYQVFINKDTLVKKHRVIAKIFDYEKTLDKYENLFK